MTKKQLMEEVERLKKLVQPCRNLVHDYELSPNSKIMVDVDIPVIAQIMREIGEIKWDKNGDVNDLTN